MVRKPAAGRSGLDRFYNTVCGLDVGVKVKYSRTASGEAEQQRRYSCRCSCQLRTRTGQGKPYFVSEPCVSLITS